jgi:CheY-like chemotaxis protein
MSMNELTDRARLVRDYATVRPVLADASRLGQVFLNLLLNAAQAFASDDRRTNEIRIALRQEDDHVRIEVADNGQGIAPDLLERIFEPFFTTKPAGVGTGLGLSICRSIVDSMTGRLTVESRVGRGSTFVVLLPNAEHVTHEADADNRVLVSESASAATDERAGTTVRVLIVDDEQALATTLARVLERDHDVVAVTSGAAALELLLNGTGFDVVVCDVVMPGLSGADLHRVLERLRPDVARRIIFMTGADGMSGVDEFLSGIVNARIEKPIDIRRLGSLIREVAAA